MNKPRLEAAYVMPPHENREADERTVFGFWVYLMTDCVLFASLFATFVVLRHATFGAPSSEELFDLPFVVLETLILLTSSFTAGVGVFLAKAGKRTQALGFLGATLFLGLAFLTLEIKEFAHFVSVGAGWGKSAFLSAFFTLVGTHGAHVAAGTLWLVILVMQMLRHGLDGKRLRGLTVFSLFWHFLDIVWIFIFTIVYLFGLI